MLYFIAYSSNWLAITLVPIEMPTFCACIIALLVINLPNQIPKLACEINKLLYN